MEEILDDFRENKNVTEKIYKTIILYAFIFFGAMSLIHFGGYYLELPSFQSDGVDYPLEILVIIIIAIYIPIRLANELFLILPNEKDLKYLIYIFMSITLGSFMFVLTNNMFFYKYELLNLNILFLLQQSVVVAVFCTLLSYFKLKRLKGKDVGLPLLLIITFFIIAPFLIELIMKHR